jgi:hypothetical protein
MPSWTALEPLGGDGYLSQNRTVFVNHEGVLCEDGHRNSRLSNEIARRLRLRPTFGGAVILAFDDLNHFEVGRMVEPGSRHLLTALVRRCLVRRFH